MIIPVITVALLAFAYCLFFHGSSRVAGRVVYRRSSVRQKLIALTFDDGPNEPFTTQILSILREHNVHATFFIVGKNAARFPETVKRIHHEGHAIGNHSYCHSFLQPILHPYFRQELERTQRILTDLTGTQPTLFRPPWFFRQPWMLRTARAMGLTTVTGTFASDIEALQLSVHEIARTTLRRARPGAILCFHDGYNSKQASRAKTVQALSLVIPRLHHDGYEFVTVPQLLDGV